MHLPRGWALATCIAACSSLSWSLVACGGSVVSNALGAVDAGEAPQGPTGTISAQMEVPVGSVISKASYKLTGPNSFYRSSTLDFPATRDVNFGIDEVPATDGYNLDVTLTSPDGSNVCTSS